MEGDVYERNSIQESPNISSVLIVQLHHSTALITRPIFPAGVWESWVTVPVGALMADIFVEAEFIYPPPPVFLGETETMRQEMQELRSKMEVLEQVRGGARATG